MTLNIHGMMPGDVYEDAQGQRHIVIGYWTEPVVTMAKGESLETVIRSGEAKEVTTAGIHGLMWQGFKLVRRHDKGTGQEEGTDG